MNNEFRAKSLLAGTINPEPPAAIAGLYTRPDLCASGASEEPAWDGKEIQWRHGTVDLACGEVRYKNGRRHGLSERETALLRYLAGHAGQVISRDELLAEVWRVNPQRTFTRTVDMHVALLRGKLRDNRGKPRTLLTVHGQGYMLKAHSH